MKCLLCGKKINMIIAKELRGGERARVFYCKKCELGILDNLATGKDLKEYYDTQYRKVVSPKLGSGMDPKELFQAEASFQNDRINLLKKHFGKKKRLLDVGCSSGMFLWHARKYVREVVGIDYDSRSARYAGRKCGCRTYSKDIEETDLKPGSFDIICAFEVLEHTNDPREFILRHKKYLKPNGIFAIEVPNIRDPLLYVYDVPFYEKFYFHRSHLWYFSAKSLNKLMVQNGFRGKVSFLQGYNFMNHMNWIFRNAPQSEGLIARRKPVLPIRDSVNAKTKSALNSFIQIADKAYKKKLTDLGISSLLFYIGKMD